MPCEIAFRKQPRNAISEPECNRHAIKAVALGVEHLELIQAQLP
jgi:hypothetical protein